MEKTITRFKFLQLVLLFNLLALGLHSQTTYTFNYTGSAQTITLTAGSYSIQCWGGDGGDGGGAAPPLTGTGGKGGYTSGVYNVATTTTLYVYVGGKGQSNNTGAAASVAAPGGWNGGGGGFNGSTSTNYKGGGGGGTDVRTTLNATYLNRVIVAGGGGGGGGSTNAAFIGIGGHGGGTTGQNGILAASQVAHNGLGGSQTAGGSGGIYGSSIGVAGSFGLGGDGGSISGNIFPAGGGGGGWYGGGGGATQGGSGGGGSGYIGGVTSGTTIMFGQPGFLTNPVTTGNGLVIIKELCNFSLAASNATLSNSLNPVICSGQSLTLTTNAVSNYSWSDGSSSSSLVVSPTSNTVYVLTALSPSNCTTSRSISITVSAGQPTLSVVSSTNQTCLGKTATLTASGAVTYTWSNGVTNGVSFNPSVTTVYTVTGENGCGTATAATAITIAPLPVSLAITPTVVCAGSPANLVVTAAATSYSYLPLNTSNGTGNLIVAPLVNTTYTVSVSDGTCQGQGIISLATNPNPTIGVTSTGTDVCEGDPFYLTATGGVNYTWTPGNLSGQSVTVNPTSPTAYVVTGDNSFGCTSNTSTFVVTIANPTPVISANANLICAGESVTLTATGANSYNWSGGGSGGTSIQTPATTGVITVTGAVGSCTGAASTQIDVFVPPVTITAPSTLCSGSPANLTANGGVSYTWNPGGVVSNVLPINPTVSSTYTVSAHTPTGNLVCLSDKTVSVNVLPNPNVTATADRTVICKNETTTITATGANSYNWIGISAGSSIVATSSLITILNYTVVGTGSNGCTTEVSTQIKVNSCNGLNELNGQVAGIKLYPNPNSGEFTLEAESKLDLNIVNQLGQVVKTIQLNEMNSFKVKVSGLSNGVYFIKDKNNSKVVCQKVVVN